MRYYIATRLENHKKHNMLQDYLYSLGHENTYDWTTHGPVWRSGMERVVEVSWREVDGVAKAQIVIIMMPGGRGTHVEFGVALGLQKVVIFYSENEKDHEVNEAFCAFYAHPGIVKVKTEQELFDTCKRMMGDVRPRRSTS